MSPVTFRNLVAYTRRAPVDPKLPVTIRGKGEQPPAEVTVETWAELDTASKRVMKTGQRISLFA